MLSEPCLFSQPTASCEHNVEPCQSHVSTEREFCAHTASVLSAYKCHKRACPLQARAELRSNPAYVLPHTEVLLREAQDASPAGEQPAPAVLQALRPGTC